MEPITREKILSLHRKPLYDAAYLRLCMQLLNSRNKEVGKVPQLVTAAVTGAAAGVLVKLTETPGASKSFFGGCVPYHPSFSAGLNGRKLKATERVTAVSLAQSARKTSLTMLEGFPPESPISINGLGLTAAIATDRKRKGADEMFLAMETCEDQTYTVDLLFERGKWSREQQDELCQIFAINLILFQNGIDQVPIFSSNFPGACFSAEKLFSLDQKTFTLDPSIWRPTYANAIQIPDLMTDVSCLMHSIDGEWESVNEMTDQHCIIATSGNPYTEGHRYLAWVMEQIGLKPIHSVEIIHPHKGRIPDEDLARRLETFRGRAPVLVTKGYSFFAQKAEVFPRASFAVGVDVAKILLDETGNNRAIQDLETFLRLRTQIYVFPRYTDDGHLETLHGINVPSRYKSVFIPIDIAPPPVSSSLMRAAKNGDPV